MKQPRASRFAGAPASVTTLSVGPELSGVRAPALAPPPPTPPGASSSVLTLTPEQQRVADLWALLEFEEQDRERARRARERADDPVVDDALLGSFLDP